MHFSGHLHVKTLASRLTVFANYICLISVCNMAWNSSLYFRMSCCDIDLDEIINYRTGTYNILLPIWKYKLIFTFLLYNQTWWRSIIKKSKSNSFLTMKQKIIHFTNINLSLLIIPVKSSHLPKTKLKTKQLFHFHSYTLVTENMEPNGKWWNYIYIIKICKILNLIRSFLGYYSMILFNKKCLYFLHILPNLLRAIMTSHKILFYFLYAHINFMFYSQKTCLKIFLDCLTFFQNKWC
jgi:hypothetical protein